MVSDFLSVHQHDFWEVRYLASLPMLVVTYTSPLSAPGLSHSGIFLLQLEPGSLVPW